MQYCVCFGCIIMRLNTAGKVNACGEIHFYYRHNRNDDIFVIKPLYWFLCLVIINQINLWICYEISVNQFRLCFVFNAKNAGVLLCTVSEFDDLRSLTRRQQVIRVYESSKMCPEVISPLDFECEKASIQHLTPQCKDTCDARAWGCCDIQDASKLHDELKKY